MSNKYGPLDHDVVWAYYAHGQLPAEIGRSMGRPPDAIYALIYKAGGIRPAARVRSMRHLALAEREEISRGIAAGETYRGIAARLGRAPSTISREISRHGGRACYRALTADRAAWKAAQRPKRCKLVACPALCAEVERRLKQRWSPEQIAGWLRREHPDDPEWWVSHETIYRSLFVQSRGALNHELTAYLRTRRVMRRPRGANRYRGNGMGQLRDVVSIRERPAEAEDRAVPGHWEGDLICGSAGSAVGTLVERSSRLVMLVKLDKVDAETVAAALRTHILSLPEHLRRSLTWDQGKEMGRHVQFTLDTGVKVYFCDPKSPWQRGSNENTNGLLRQLPAQAHRPQAPQPGRAQRHRSGAQRTSSQDPRVHDTITEVRRGCCADPLSPQAKNRTRRRRTPPAPPRHPPSEIPGTRRASIAVISIAVVGKVRRP